MDCEKRRSFATVENEQPGAPRRHFWTNRSADDDATDTNGRATRRVEEKNFFYSCVDACGAIDEGYVRIHRSFERTNLDKK